MADFTKVVTAEWKRRKGDAEAANEEIQRKLDKALQRKDKLINLRLDGEISQETYNEKDLGLAQEIEAAEIELRSSESEFLDFEHVLAFAEKIVTNPARLWLESSLDQRQRLQLTYFPDGLEFDGERFGTPSNSSFFRLLTHFTSCQSLLASPTGFEPVLSP